MLEETRLRSSVRKHPSKQGGEARRGWDEQTLGDSPWIVVEPGPGVPVRRGLVTRGAQVLKENFPKNSLPVQVPVRKNSVFRDSLFLGIVPTGPFVWPVLAVGREELPSVF